MGHEDFQQAGDEALPAPAGKAVVNRLPGAVAFGQVAPGRTGPEDPEDAVENAAVGHTGATSFPGALGRQVRQQKVVFVVGELEAGHVSFLSRRELAVVNIESMNSVQFDFSDRA